MHLHRRVQNTTLYGRRHEIARYCRDCVARRCQLVHRRRRGRLTRRKRRLRLPAYEAAASMSAVNDATVDQSPSYRTPLMKKVGVPFTPLRTPLMKSARTRAS